MPPMSQHMYINKHSFCGTRQTYLFEVVQCVKTVFTHFGN